MSSFISNITFKGDTKGNMKVTLRGTTEYLYEDVPRKVYTDFVKAPSKGTFYNKHIRNADYKVS